FQKYADRGEVVNAPDCGSGTRGFDPHRSPHFSNLGCSQAVRHRVLIPCIVGSNPASPAISCGSSSVVEHHLAKVGVAGSNPVFRSIVSFKTIYWRYSQVVRQRSVKPSPPVQIRLPPQVMSVWRNWQTRGTQNSVSIRMCRFDPDHRYY